MRSIFAACSMFGYRVFARYVLLFLLFPQKYHFNVKSPLINTLKSLKKYGIPLIYRLTVIEKEPRGRLFFLIRSAIIGA